eukprot:7029814-Prymnesium_polylepis.1
METWKVTTELAGSDCNGESTCPPHSARNRSRPPYSCTVVFILKPPRRVRLGRIHSAVASRAWRE